MEEGIGRVGMKMLMMIEGMGMISMINNITERDRGRGNMDSLLDKDTHRARVKGMVGSVGVVSRLTYMT